MSKNIITQLKLFPIFKNIEDDFLLKVVAIIEQQSIRKNKFIYKEGDAADRIYFLISGTLKIGAHSKSGKEVIKSILRPEAMFGEMSLYNEDLRNGFAQCIENNTELYSIESKLFSPLIKSNMQLAQNIISLLSTKLKFAEKRIESLVFKDARERIIDFLLDNAKSFGRHIGYEMLFKHSLTQQDIANFTGTSRQTVTSVLNDLKKTNKIYFKRKSILIRDMSALS